MTVFELKVKFWQFWKKYILNAFAHDRQPFHIGWTRPRVPNIDEIEGDLIDAGWQPNYFSFADKGQLTSMRKMFRDTHGSWLQDHIRIHTDGEIRGHRELSYEESAITHIRGTSVLELPEDVRAELISILT